MLQVYLAYITKLSRSHKRHNRLRVKKTAHGPTTNLHNFCRLGVQYLIFIIMSQLVSDLVFRDLKQKGLEMSPGVQVKVPELQPKKESLIVKLGSLVTRKKEEPGVQKMFVFPIIYSYFGVIKKNGLFIFRYTFEESDKNLSVQAISETPLPQQILEVHYCQDKYLQDRDFPMVFRTKQGFIYYNYDFKDFAVKQRNTVKGNFIGISWINDKQLIALEERSLTHYSIVNEQIKAKSVVELGNIRGSKDIIKKTWIMCNYDEQQDSLITVFYALVAEDAATVEATSMKIKIKQITRTLEGELIGGENPVFPIESSLLEYREGFDIVGVGEYYCLQMNNQILIVKKKFGKYMFLDNMAEIMMGYKVKLCKKGLVISIGQKLMELNCVQFADPKCSSRICDVITFPKEFEGYNQHFREIWPVLANKDHTLVFVFVNGEQIVLSHLIKLEPMEKVLSLVRQTPKDRLEIVQEMAQNLGISRKDFYLKLWSISPKQNADIYAYLLPTQDIASIKKELKATLRTRTIQVTEMLKILEKITELNIKNLRKNLNQKNIMELLKNDFLRRKIKLNEMNKMLDHRIFDTIYNSSLLTIFVDIVSEELDPVQPKYDPLHINMEHEVYKELKSLQSVMQQFKVILLEDYKLFLRSFLERFPDKILGVLERFSFILPNYPFEIEVQQPSKINEPILKDPKPNDTPQEQWFQSVTVAEWSSEMTKERIIRLLYEDYPTSKIVETIDEFYSSHYGVDNRMGKHGLIVASLDEYRRKIKRLSKIDLYLNICEFANEISLEKDGDPDISCKIINSLSKKNRLAEPDVGFCKLYASMHYFMLKNKIISKAKLDIISLSKLKPENLLALFFLENKQRKEHILEGFKDLYEDKEQFLGVLKKFAESENCSNIELQILIQEVIDKGQKFQEENQEIIEILINGFCLKVEIRASLMIFDEEENAREPNLIDQVYMSRELALKVNRIKQLKRCKNIFNAFQLDKMSYQEALDLEEDNAIFKLIMTKFFELRDTEERQEVFEVEVQGEAFNLVNQRHLLTILIYLQESVYYSARPFDIFIIYGLELIMWKQFEVIAEILKDEDVLEQLQIDKHEMLQSLIVKALETIYLDQEAVYDEQTKEQIMNILSIDDTLTPLKTRELAKLDLVDIFMNWELEIHTIHVHSICENWKTESREEFILDLVERYIDKLDFSTFSNIYKILETIKEGTTDVEVLTTEFVKFCDFYAMRLAEQRRFKEVIEMVVFLMNETRDQINYCMLVESYVHSIIELFPEDLDRGKKLIEFFVQKYDTPEDYSIKQLLQSYFDEAVIALWERSEKVKVSSKFCFDEYKKADCAVPYDHLWQISTRNASNVEELYFNYMFLAMGLNNPSKGFGEIVGISYNLNKVTQIMLSDLEKYFESNPDLVFVDYQLLLAQYLFDGLTGQAAYIIGLPLQEDRKSKFDLIVKQLRAGRNEKKEYDKTLNIISKVKGEVFNKNKRSLRKEKYRQAVKEIKQMEEELRKLQLLQIEQEQEEERPVENLNAPVYLTWKEVQKQKINISQTSVYMKIQKDLINQVFDKWGSQTKIPEKPKERKPNMFEMIFHNFKAGGDKTQNTVSLLREQRYGDLKQMPLNTVAQSIDQLFSEEPTKDYMELVEILDNLGMGYPEKRQYLKLAKVFSDNLSNEVKRRLFPLQFFMTPVTEQTQTESKYELVYRQLLPNIRRCIQVVTVSELKQLANLVGIILESSEFSSRVFMETLVYVGSNLPFDSSSVLLAEDCMAGLSEFPDVIRHNYEYILAGMTHDKEMKPYVRENLIKIMYECKYDDVAQEIRLLP